MSYSVNDFRRRFSGRKPGIQGAQGAFSVLVPLVEKDGQAHILYELRSAEIDRQPSEVCFPGGEIEEGETPRQAALRETREEIGIEEKEISVISQLDIMHPPTDIVIYPFLGEIGEEALSHLSINRAEVAECFLVPVSFLEREPFTYHYTVPHGVGEDFPFEKVGLSRRDYKWRPVKHEIISWEFEGKFIWGLTALITRWTLEILTGKRR